MRRGGHGDPQILADLDAELRAVDLEREVGAEVGLLPGDGDRLAGDAGARGEPAVFVEFAVVGDVGLGHDAQDASLREYDGAVVERRTVTQREADDQRQREFARGFGQFGQGLVGRVEQRGLQQQIAARVAGHGQLGECHDLHAALCRVVGERCDPLRIVGAVADLHLRNGRRDFEKSEMIQFPIFV